MPDITCRCGQNLSVTFADAGSRQTCRQCGVDVIVPSLVKLKQLSGDRDPLLNNWEKLVKAVQRGEPPFDGACQKCAARPAQVAVEIELSVLSERVLAGNERGTATALRERDDARPTKSGTEIEYWDTIRVPHLLCEQCHRDFAAMRKWQWLLVGAMLCAALILGTLAILLFILGRLAKPLALVGAPIFVVLLVLCFALQRHWRKDPLLSRWLMAVPLVKDILETEEEYSLRKQRTLPFSSTAYRDTAQNR